MSKSYDQYSGRGNPNVKSPRQKPLGDLLREAREKKGWTREQLYKATDIGTSSIVRYEQAGKDEDGQYPRSPALAKLCIALGIDPLQAMLGCLPNEDYGMYESLSGHQVWRYNQPQYMWVEKQLETVTKDLMLLRSFIEHFLPYIDRDKLPEDLHWLLDKGKVELDRIADLEARLLRMGVFLLPMGSFLLPSEGSDSDGRGWIFDFDQPGVVDPEAKENARSVMARQLANYAKRFGQLAYQLENLEEERERHQAFLYKMTGGREGKPATKKNPEEDLPSPPGSLNADET